MSPPGSTHFKVKNFATNPTTPQAVKASQLLNVVDAKHTATLACLCCASCTCRFYRSGLSMLKSSLGQLGVSEINTSSQERVTRRLGTTTSVFWICGTKLRMHIFFVHRSSWNPSVSTIAAEYPSVWQLRSSRRSMRQQSKRSITTEDFACVSWMRCVPSRVRTFVACRSS